MNTPSHHVVSPKFAIVKKPMKTAKLKDIDRPKTLKCYCNVVISDMKTIILTSTWEAEIAIMTNDKGLMSMSRDYYDNPKCCWTLCKNQREQREAIASRDVT